MKLQTEKFALGQSIVRVIRTTPRRFYASRIRKLFGACCFEDISFVSHCEHHLAPINGFVDVAYVPSERIVGISKIARVVECFARRLQTQER